jgi:hypothetical protein
MEYMKFVDLTSVLDKRAQKLWVGEIKGRLDGLVRIGNQTTYKVDQKVSRTAMARVFDLRDVLELVYRNVNSVTLMAEASFTCFGFHTLSLVEVGFLIQNSGNISVLLGTGNMRSTLPCKPAT